MMKSYSLIYVTVAFLQLINSSSLPEEVHDNDAIEEPFKVYRIYPQTNQQLEFLNFLQSSDLNFELNFWKDPNKLRVPCDIMISKGVQDQFENLLHSKNLNYTIIIEDVHKYAKHVHRIKWMKEIIHRLIVEKEYNPWDNNILMDSNGISNELNFNFHDFQDYDTMRTFMHSLEQKYPQIAKVYSIGNSFENRPIQMIKIGYPVSSESKKAIWIDAGIHAREWISSSTAMYFINELVKNYDTNAQLHQYVQNLTWYITPIVNPDGYEYSRSSKSPKVRLWRKSRSVSEKCGKKRCCMGVDLNRNFDFHFGETGSSNNLCQETYQGPSAFSEPESRAVRDFVTAHINEVQAFITLHSYSENWMYSWGYRKHRYPADVSELHSVANEAKNKIESVYGTEYTIGSAADAMYEASGGSDDWAKSKGVKYVYLIELPPDVKARNGFIVSPNMIIPTGRETFEGVKVVANALLKNNGLTLVNKT